MKTSGRVGIVLLAAACTAFLQYPAVAAGSRSSVFTAVRGGEAGILKRVVVSYLGLLATYPELRSSTHAKREQENALRQMDMSISSMLFLFDSLNDPHSLRVFASLDSYYLGEHSAEIYNCLARRKGSVLKPFLRQIFSQSQPECVAKFGEAGAKPKAGQVAICLTKKEAAGRVGGLIEQINRGVGCTDQELLQ